MTAVVKPVRKQYKLLKSELSESYNVSRTTTYTVDKRLKIQK